MGHDHSFPGIEGQGQRSRLGFGFQFDTQSVGPRSSASREGASVLSIKSWWWMKKADGRAAGWSLYCFQHLDTVDWVRVTGRTSDPSETLGHLSQQKVRFQKKSGGRKHSETGYSQVHM